MKRLAAFAFILSVFCAWPAGAQDSSLLDATRSFLSSIDSEHRALATSPFNSDERLNWHFIPKKREGLPLKRLKEDQQVQLLAIVRAGLSEQGYTKVDTIRMLELVLREMEGRDFRDPEMYHIQIFGEPSEKGSWSVRYEGHHISLSWTYYDGALIASSPQFLGTNPADVRIDGPMKGTRVLAAVEDLGRGLVMALDETQRKAAVISDTAPRDVLTGADREAAIQEDLGIAYSALNPEQQGMLISLIEEHASVQKREVARERLDEIRQAGLDDIKFAWMGSLEKGQGHYYRIQGSAFLIEYDNTQNEANHAHSVWRDFEGDFGRDVLKAHHAAFFSADHPLEHRH